MKQFLCAVLVTAAPMLAQVTINGLPTREFGQPTLVAPLLSAAPNLVEGRELFSPSGIAFDNNVNPPHVYIADTLNNRVLGWSNANNLTKGNFADLVIGQPDMYSTFTEGPGHPVSTGLSVPTGLAVDASGNLYVADSGNNRILRFKAPYKQQAGDLPVDLVIGQKTSSSGNQINQGQQNPSANSLYLFVANSAGVLAAGLAVDGQGNLWVADAGNNRVLGFPPSSLAANTSLPAASVVLGQTSFVSNQLPTSNEVQTNLGFLLGPTGVAVDSQGNLYVTDQGARAIQYVAPIQIGQSGSKVLGLPPTQTTAVTYPTASTLGSVTSAGTTAPQGIFVLNGSSGASVFVCDSPQNRVVRYDTFTGAWTVMAPANSPLQSGVTGQTSATTGQANQGQINPSNQTLSYPIAGAINTSNGEMWIVDQANNRVVAFANQGGGTYSTASRVIGQTDFIYSTANLIVGSELWLTDGGGMAIDSTSTPPHLYIADTVNNRILGFKNAYAVGVGGSGVLTQTADLVIGQADLFHSTINYPNGAQGQPSPTGLYQPIGLAVDANGNLWVADSLNGRAVRFPAPFAQPAGSLQTANVVLGQPDLVTYNQGVSQFSMTLPYGLTLFSDSGPAGSGSVAISDAAANRILVFIRPTGGDFSSNAPAQFVIGQPNNFSQSTSGSGSGQLNSPRHIAVDSSDRLFVCDYNNNRLSVFPKPTLADPSPSFTLDVPISQPLGLTVSYATGLSWVTSTASNGVVYQFPEFHTLQGTAQPTQTIQSYGPVALTLDPFDNLIVADSANRVTFYFGQLFYRNTASYAAGVQSNAGPTPGMLVEIGLENSSFKLTPSYSGTIQNTAPPWPLVQNNIQVTVNGFPAPIFRMDSNVISFEIPNEAGQSGPAAFVVTNTSTGQVLAVNTGVYNMQPASPGIYTSNSGGTGQVAANVYDAKGNVVGNGINGPSNPVLPGGIITLWLTGAGYISSLPPDGTAPGPNQYPQFTPLVYVDGELATVIGSQISPQYPGLWQINFVVPLDTAASTIQPCSVIVNMDDYNSNIGANPSNFPNGSPGPDILLQASGNGGNGLITTIYVK